jgi:hypothetical protein
MRVIAGNMRTRHILIGQLQPMDEFLAFKKVKNTVNGHGRHGITKLFFAVVDEVIS